MPDNAAVHYRSFFFTLFGILYQDVYFIKIVNYFLYAVGEMLLLLSPGMTLFCADRPITIITATCISQPGEQQQYRCSIDSFMVHK